MTDIRRTTCPYDCPASCGLLATIENGRVAGVAGDPEHPASKGLICKNAAVSAVRQQPGPDPFSYETDWE